MRLHVLLAVAQLAALAAGRMCTEDFITEAMGQLNDPACVGDMKSCLHAGTCVAAGISEARMCECYTQVVLPVAGRAMDDYDCLPSSGSPRTLLEDWTQCTRLKTEVRRPRIERRTFTNHSPAACA